MTDAPPIRFAFAGDRQISVEVLKFITDQGMSPLALLLPGPERATHASQLKSLCPNLGATHVLEGNTFKSDAAQDLMHDLELDYLICIHFPLIIPPSVLAIPREGVLNLHPAYLPFSRGWHNSIWAILENKPYGATLHFMNEGVDTGDIVHQRKLEVRPEDTGDTAYKRALALEVEVFKEAWPRLVDRTYVRQAQDQLGGTRHKAKELYRPEVQELDLKAEIKVGDLLRKLRALTTNRPEEAAYFTVGTTRYRVRVTITPETSNL